MTLSLNCGVLTSKVNVQKETTHKELMKEQQSTSLMENE